MSIGRAGRAARGSRWRGGRGKNAHALLRKWTACRHWAAAAAFPMPPVARVGRNKPNGWDEGLECARSGARGAGGWAMGRGRVCHFGLWGRGTLTRSATEGVHSASPRARVEAKGRVMATLAHAANSLSVFVVVYRPKGS